MNPTIQIQTGNGTATGATFFSDELVFSGQNWRQPKLNQNTRSIHRWKAGMMYIIPVSLNSTLDLYIERNQRWKFCDVQVNFMDFNNWWDSKKKPVEEQPWILEIWACFLASFGKTEDQWSKGWRSRSFRSKDSTRCSWILDLIKNEEKWNSSFGERLGFQFSSISGWFMDEIWME